MIYATPRVTMLGSVDPFFDQLCPQPFSRSREIDWRTERVKEFIERHPTRVRGKLDGVCKQLDLGISDRQVRQLFIKDSSGVGIGQYARIRRLAIAATKLKIKDIPIKAIAFDAGYQSACHFARGFKSVFLVSPMEFRKMWNKRPRGREFTLTAD